MDTEDKLTDLIAIAAPAIAGMILAVATVFSFVTETTAAPTGWDNPAKQPILYFGEQELGPPVEPTGAYLDCLVQAYSISPSSLPICVR